MGRNEYRLAIRPRLIAEHAPHQALLDVLAILGQQGHKRHLSAGGCRIGLLTR
jgi:hypothetical protein